MEHMQSEKMKLYLLLQQIQMTDDQYAPYFENGQLQRVSIHRKSRRWQFNIKLDKPLPIAIYSTFMQRINEAFSAIAQISIAITSEIASNDEQLVIDYWPIVIEGMQDMSPPIRSRLLSQKPVVTGDKLSLTCMNDLELQTLKSKYAPLIAESYLFFGFHKPMIDFERIEQSVEEEEAQEEFFRQVAQEEEEMGRRALEDLQKREQSMKDSPKDAPTGPFILGNPIKPDEVFVEIRSIQEEERMIAIEGFVFDVEVKELRSGRSLLQIKMTDYTDSMIVKMFSRNDQDAQMMTNLKKGAWVRARGRIENDSFIRDLSMMANDIMEIAPIIHQDKAPEDRKRIELHAHTTMSQMDAVVTPAALVAQAAKWGHPAIAITDHANVQAFPDAYAAGKKNGIKVLFGMEANLVDDGVPIAYDEQDIDLETATYVVFDVETTGLSAVYDTIIELAAVKIKDGEEISRFERFANPHHSLSATTINLTGITDDMVRNAPEVSEVVKDFSEWIGDSILVAHNASFDMGFFYEACKKADLPVVTYPVIDTLELARLLHPEMGNHRLNTLTKKYNIELTQHHRAIYDAEATGFLFLKLLEGAMATGIKNHLDFNANIGEGDAYKRARPTHCTLLATNEEGMKNLFKLVSYSHMHYFYRVPRIPRSLLIKYRKGLLVGSGCANGEVFNGIMQKSMDEVEEIAKFYDYLEIQPKSIYNHLIELDLIRDEWNLEDIMRKLMKLGKKVGLPVCATGNVHYINKTDGQFRKVLVRSQGGANPLNRHALPEAHFRTTDEMLEEFAFLGKEVAEEIVIDNPRKIMERVGDVKPIKDDLYTPKIEGAEEEVRELTYSMAHQIYGEQLPDIVTERVEKELKSIIGHGFAVIYLISHKLVKKSLDDGYLVGSRGSVGSSLVATMMEITEVNPLPPHYVCPTCKEAEFFTDGSVSSGYDLPHKNCPTCDVPYAKDGQDIPFETFLGFEGDKVPDIDLSAPRC